MVGLVGMLINHECKNQEEKGREEKEFELSDLPIQGMMDIIKEELVKSMTNDIIKQHEEKVESQREIITELQSKLHYCENKEEKGALLKKISDLKLKISKAPSKEQIAAKVNSSPSLRLKAAFKTVKLLCGARKKLQLSKSYPVGTVVHVELENPPHQESSDEEDLKSSSRRKTIRPKYSLQRYQPPSKYSQSENHKRARSTWAQLAPHDFIKKAAEAQYAKHYFPKCTSLPDRRSREPTFSKRREKPRRCTWPGSYPVHERLEVLCCGR